jgi:hypothetical protein
MLKPRVNVLKRGDHRENGLTILVGLNSTRAERAPVTKSINLESDRQGDVASAKKIAVQRVRDASVVDCASGRDETLR